MTAEARARAASSRLSARARPRVRSASGVAGVLELARLMVDVQPERTIRFVLFGTEEPPYFNTPDMGSRAYAARAAEAGEDIVGMLSLETIGYYSDVPGSQPSPKTKIADRNTALANSGTEVVSTLVTEIVRRSSRSHQETQRTWPPSCSVKPSAAC